MVTGKLRRLEGVRRFAPGAFCRNPEAWAEGSAVRLLYRATPGGMVSPRPPARPDSFFRDRAGGTLASQLEALTRREAQRAKSLVPKS